MRNEAKHPEMPWVEQAVLFVLGAGASLAEIASIPGGETPLELDAVERAMANLERRGLLSTVKDSTGTHHALTARDGSRCSTTLGRW